MGRNHFAQALSARALAKQIRDNDPDMFSKLKAKPADESKAGKSPGSGVPSLLNVCHFCKAQKHTVSWKYCESKKTTVVTGGTCYSCSQAARFLKISRSYDRVKSAGALEKFLQVSQVERAHLQKQGRDVCICVRCKPKAAPKSESA